MYIEVGPSAPPIIALALCIVPSGISFAEALLSFLLHPHLACPILLLAAGCLRAKSVLLGESAPKQELVAALCFGISQILLIFGDCAMAVASV